MALPGATTLTQWSYPPGQARSWVPSPTDKAYHPPSRNHVAAVQRERTTTILDSPAVKQGLAGPPPRTAALGLARGQKALAGASPWLPREICLPAPPPQSIRDVIGA